MVTRPSRHDSLSRATCACARRETTPITLATARVRRFADTVVTTNPTTGAVTVAPTLVGRKIENTPERTFSLASEYRLSGLIPGLSVNAAGYYVGERAINQFNQAFTPSYTLFDVGAAYQGEMFGNPVTFRVTAQNVADKKYFSSTGANILSQGPPRMIKFSVQTRFGQ